MSINFDSSNYSMGIIHSTKEESSHFKHIKKLSKAATITAVVGGAVLFGSAAAAGATTLAAGLTTAFAIGAAPVVVITIASAAILILGVGAIASAATLTSALILHIVSEVKKQQHICKYSGLIETADKNDRLNPTLHGKCDALPTKDCKDTFEWKCKLVEAAEHNILVSGNYFAGQAFADFLKVINEQMKAKPKLKVCLIGAPEHLTKSNRKQLENLQKYYPKQFSFTDSSIIKHSGNGLKITTNHTKSMVIDYGKYYILGGSGVKDNFNKIGITQEDKNDAIKNGKLLPEKKESAFLPGSFRDMDFVFRADDKNPEAGQDVYRQTLLLIHRWEQYAVNMKAKRIVNTFKKDELGVFSGKQGNKQPEDTITTQLLKSKIPKWTTLTTKVKDFDENDAVAKRATMEILSSGPEQSESVFTKKILLNIQRAKSRIAINQMYFHPTTEILTALKEAAERGVKVEIITTGTFNNSQETKGWSPKSHLAFAPRNKYNYTKLYFLIKDSERKNLSIYEFEQRKIGLHKKAIIIDDEIVIAGSSNLGTKSLIHTSDYEINFISKSKKFAEETNKVFETDKKHSVQITPKKLPLSIKIRAWIHKKIAFAIG